ncbi:MAG: tetratricopeptide repeat protein [Acidobacteriota bacterium]|nr:tetratricopeptide repeat protein [Blastocatellia bacterium]MDW8241224.1 tetratricopeptide repeat protein [Acidobacteriota bacterium]
MNRQRLGCRVWLVLIGLIASSVTVPGQSPTKPSQTEKSSQTQATPSLPSSTGESPSVEQLRTRRVQAYLLYPKAIQEATRGNMYKAIELLKQVVSLDPTAPEPHVTLGEIHYGLRNTNEARREAQLALALNPKHAGAHKLLGRIYLDEAQSSGDQDKAKLSIAEFRQVVEVDDTDTEAWQSLAELYRLTGQQNEFVNALTRWTSNDPMADRAFFELGRHYHAQRKYRLAAENYARAYELQPIPEIAVLFAQSLLAQGYTADALRIYQEARQRTPNDDDLEVNYAGALIAAGQYEEAMSILQSQLKKRATNLEALWYMAQALRRSGRRSEAIRLLKDALNDIDVTESLDFQQMLASIYEETHQVDEAVAVYRNILDVILNPDGTVSKNYLQIAEDTLARIGLAYRRAGRQADAIRAFERMRTILGADNPQADLLILDTLLEEEQYQEVVDKAEALAKQFEDKREFRLVQAQALARMGRVDQAIKLLDGLLSNSLDDLAVLSVKASIISDAERYQEAKAVLEEGLRRDPRNTALLIQLSMVQEKLGKPVDAEATLRAILERDPENQVALNNLGYYLVERGERLDEALALIQRAVNIDPTNGAYLDSLGWAYFQKGRLEEAQMYLEQALRFEPRDSTIHEHLGDVFMKKGQPDRARQAYEQALRFARQQAERERIRKKLQSQGDHAK